ncbi:hypothetical protein B0H13DRAFT_2558272 [Mycena leptocephala]|nr:hypothetical protein B0H13DRAFT_2558272 [Mycena leptocephala]
MTDHTRQPNNPSQVSHPFLPPNTVKAEQQYSACGKTEPESSSTSEIAILMTLFMQKADGDDLKPEITLQTEILEVKNQNQRFKLKRAADATKIESLEAELASLRKLVVKQEDDTQRVRSSNKKHIPEVIVVAALEIVDSDDEPENSPSEPCLGPIDARASPSAPVTNPGGARSERPSIDAGASAPEASLNSDVDVQVRDDVIDVVIKIEGEPDKFKRVTLIKSEENGFDIWNVDGFGLGPTIKVDEKYNRTFSAKVIRDAFGGCPGYKHLQHWRKLVGRARKTPYLTLKRTWSPSLPVSLGEHGIGFCALGGSLIKPEPLNIVVQEGPDNWRLMGTYNYHLWGEIAPYHIPRIPEAVLSTWAARWVVRSWGRSLISAANAKLTDARKVNFTSESVLEAFHDGRLQIPFTILQCVGYPEEWFEKLLYYEKHPKPKGPESKVSISVKRPASAKAQESPNKRARKSVSEDESDSSDSSREGDEESDGEDSESEESDVDSSDSEYTGGPRRIAGLPKRTKGR